MKIREIKFREAINVKAGEDIVVYIQDGRTLCYHIKINGEYIPIEVETIGETK